MFAIGAESGITYSADLGPGEFLGEVPTLRHPIVFRVIMGRILCFLHSIHDEISSRSEMHKPHMTFDANVCKSSIAGKNNGIKIGELRAPDPIDDPELSVALRLKSHYLSGRGPGEGEHLVA